MLSNFFKEVKNDLPASIVVFFVALPLCLGIALASGAPLLAGVIAGIIGGIVVGAMSASSLGVSGPAAGLATIAAAGILTLGSFEAFLLAVMIAGVIQIIMGFMRAGTVAYFFPTAVITGMLTGIGMLIIIKQLPFAIGVKSLTDISINGPIILALISLGILIFWDKVLGKKHKLFEILQGPVVVVLLGVLTTYLIKIGYLPEMFSASQMVTLPPMSGVSDFIGSFVFPDFTQISNIMVWKIAIVMAVVASLETLLCVEATDKLDPDKNITPTNRELKAQGIGNMLSGFIGGLPITQVVVRSSANISFGGKTKLSAILHGVWLLLSVLFIVNVLNMIPLAALAAILIMVGYKLAKPQTFIQMYKMGWEQFVPFALTLAVLIFEDLLMGISVGLVVSLLYVLKHNYNNSYSVKDVVIEENGRETHYIILGQEVSFFNKARIMMELNRIPVNSRVIIDASRSKDISYDVSEVISDFMKNAVGRNIEVETIDFVAREGISTSH